MDQGHITTRCMNGIRPSLGVEIPVTTTDYQSAGYTPFVSRPYTDLSGTTHGIVTYNPDVWIPGTKSNEQEIKELKTQLLSLTNLVSEQKHKLDKVWDAPGMPGYNKIMSEFQDVKNIMIQAGFGHETKISEAITRGINKGYVLSDIEVRFLRQYNENNNVIDFLADNDLIYLDQNTESYDRVVKATNRISSREYTTIKSLKRARTTL